MVANTARLGQAVWQTEEFALANLAEWGDPRESPETWNQGKYQRLAPLPELVVGQSVLDVGCGVGHGYAMIQRSVVDYVGADTPARVAVCQRLFPTATFIAGDIYTLAEFGMYDTVVAIQVLLHLPTIAEPLCELWAHTRHCLVFTIWPPTAIEELHYNTVGVLGRRFTQVCVLDALCGLHGATSIRVRIVPSAGSAAICYVQIRKNEPGHAPLDPYALAAAFVQAQ